ncbi:hypothetical protein KR093_009039, partial [Drosophila rubida]
MLVSQVLRLPWLLFLALALVNAQAQQTSISVQSGTICNPPYVSQNGVCVEPVTPSTPVETETDPTEPVTPNTPDEETTQTTLPSVSDETTSTTSPRPSSAPIRVCPPGTVLANGNCRLVHCARGVYSNGRCVIPRCPKNTAWTGVKCAAPEPVELAPIHIEKQIVDKAYKVLHNKQELLVNASLILPQREDDYEDEDYSDEATDVPENTSSRCCTVIAPRICRNQNEDNRWQCYNRRQPLCGSVCNTSKVVLKAPQATTWIDDTNVMLLMPPHPCIAQNNCNTVTDRYDCSGCASGLMTSCSSYCYSYHCNGPKCSFYDQLQFCSSPEFSNCSLCRPENGWEP